jgi:hypothetical protein
LRTGKQIFAKALVGRPVSIAARQMQTGQVQHQALLNKNTCIIAVAPASPLASCSFVIKLRQEAR